MKSFKFFVVALLMFCFGFSGVAHAKELDSEVTINDDEKFYSPEFDAFVNAFKLSDTGQLIELTKEEYKALDLKHESEDDLSSVVENEEPKMGTRDTVWSYLKFVPTKSTSYVGDPVKVSADINCTASTCSLGHGVSFSRSIAVTYGTATKAEKSAISQSLNITYTEVKATTNSFTFNLKKGQKGYVAFKPYKIRRDGYFQQCYSRGMGCFKTNKKGYVRIPKQLSDGNANGVFYFVYKKK